MPSWCVKSFDSMWFKKPYGCFGIGNKERFTRRGDQRGSSYLILNKTTEQMYLTVYVTNQNISLVRGQRTGQAFIRTLHHLHAKSYGVYMTDSLHSSLRTSLLCMIFPKKGFSYFHISIWCCEDAEHWKYVTSNCTNRLNAQLFSLSDAAELV